MTRVYGHNALFLYLDLVRPFNIINSVPSYTTQFFTSGIFIVAVYQPQL